MFAPEEYEPTAKKPLIKNELQGFFEDRRILDNNALNTLGSNDDGVGDSPDEGQGGRTATDLSAEEYNVVVESTIAHDDESYPITPDETPSPEGKSNAIQVVGMRYMNELHKLQTPRDQHQRGYTVLKPNGSSSPYKNLQVY
jgi:hypothetical protein